MTTSRRWLLRKADLQRAEQLAQSLKITPITARVLLARKLDSQESIEQFLSPRFQNLPDPFLLKGMQTAVERVMLAIDRQESIAIWGDYDVDGVTSTAQLVTFLGRCGAVVDYRIPHRDEGYGLSVAGLEELLAGQTTLLITVDCGTSNLEEIAFAREQGCDVIVIDHHKVPERLPPANVLINPMQEDCDYPFSGLASVGLVFQLLMALRRRMREAGLFEPGNEPNLVEYLDFVALGTVCDAVPLIGPNRILTAHGLRQLKKRTRIGIRALIDVCEIDGEFKASHLGFQLGPRLNAAGRLEHAGLGVELMLEQDQERALEIARKLDELNKQRREVEQRITDEAIAEVERLYGTDPPAFLLVAGEEWHHGVIGIVASRLMEKFWRPTLVIGIDGEQGKGSARSINGFDMVDGLRQVTDLLLKYGGHKMAAGLTVPRESIDELRQRMIAVASELPEETFTRPLKIDAEIPLEQVTRKLVDEVERLGPFGVGNPRPVFLTRAEKITDVECIGKQKTHLRFKSWSDTGRPYKAIGFNLADRLTDHKMGAARLVFSPQLRSYRGNSYLEFHLKDFEATSS